MLNEDVVKEVLKSLGFEEGATVKLCDRCYVNTEAEYDLECVAFVGFHYENNSLGWVASCPTWGNDGISEPLLSEQETLSGVVEECSDFFLKNFDREGMLNALEGIACVVGKENVFLNAQIVADSDCNVSIMYVHILCDKGSCWA